MAGSTFAKAFSFLSLASAVLAAPMTSVTNVFARDTGDICSATSECIPFTIEVAYGSVDAVGAGPRGAILTNGSFPGPALRMKVGECVDFLVINNLGVDTGVHFHGINQKGTPWSDGVPGLSQYATPSGQSYMYRWTADEQGAYFYHSHYKGQIMDGLYGAIFIQAADGQDTPFSAVDSSAVEQLTSAYAKSEPLFASDWTSYTFNELYGIEEAGNVDIDCASALIINGMGQQYCMSRADITANSAPQIANLTQGAGYTNKACLPPITQGNYTRNLAAVPDDVFNSCTATTGKNYTLSVNQADGYASVTFYNPGGFSLLKATIDNHKLWVYEYNGQFIQPVEVDQVPIGNGDRVSCFIKLDQPVGDYQIRVSNLGLNQLISGFGLLSYQGATGIAPNSVALMNFAGIATGATPVPFVPALAAPFPAMTVAQTADQEWHFDLQRLGASPDAYLWSVAGNTSWAMSNDDDAPLLYKNPASVQASDIIKKTQMGQWIDIVMQTSGPLAQPHPMHKHANKFFVIGGAVGPFTWNSVAEAIAANASNFNLVNPPYLDGYTTLPGSGTPTWTVFRYQVEIPGAWFFHCHMQTHLSGGMAIAIMDGVDAWPTVPADAGKTCQGNGMTNSTWTPSCYCPASCPANPSTAVNGTSSGSGSGSSSGSGSTSTSSQSNNGNGGSWNNGVWSGGNNPATSNSTTSGSSSSSSGSSTGTSSGSGSPSGSGNPIQPYKGAASSTHVSLFTVLALVAAAFAL